MASPPRSGKSQHLRYFVGAFVVAWFGFLGFLFADWSQLPLWGKVLFGAIEVSLTPGVDDVKFAFTGKGEYPPA